MDTTNRDQTPASGTVAITMQPEIISPPQQSQKQESNPRSSSKRKNDWYQKLSYTVALIGAASSALLLWWLGAKYTLQGLTFFNIHASGLIWYTLPIAITAIEIALMPHKGSKPLLTTFFLVILAFDVLTSWYGLRLDLAGKDVPLGTGFTLPRGGAIFHIAMILLSFIFAFLPEKLAKIALKETGATWL